jgi:hypothetical protein
MDFYCRNTHLYAGQQRHRLLALYRDLMRTIIVTAHSSSHQNVSEPRNTPP